MITPIKKFETNDKNYQAYVKQFRPLGKWNGQYAVEFEAFGMMDNDYRGTSGVGMKVYNSLESATAAAKRYIKKFNR